MVLTGHGDVQQLDVNVSGTYGVVQHVFLPEKVLREGIPDLPCFCHGWEQKQTAMKENPEEGAGSDPGVDLSPLMSPPAQNAFPPAALMITMSVSGSLSHFWKQK